MSSAAVTEIQRAIAKRQGELERLQEAIRRAPILQEEIRMLHGSLSLLRGVREAEAPKSESQLPLSNGAPQESLALVVRRILKQSGRPLSPSEIVSAGHAHGRTINYGTLTSMMAKQVNQGKDFTRDNTGKYALLEWDAAR